MKNFSGLTLTKEEKEQVVKDIEKLDKFFKNDPCIDIKYEAIANDNIKVSIKTSYFGVPVYSTAEDDDKIGATKKAVDAVIRKIRKIKTGVIDKNRQVASEYGKNAVINKDNKKENFKSRNLKVKEMTPAEALDFLMGEGLDLVVFYYNDQINLLVQHEKRYEYYSLQL